MKIDTLDAIFFVGRSGAGKGTQAKRLAEKIGFFYWEMGAILRGEIEKQTDIGREIKDLQNKGIWLGDEHIHKVVESHLPEVAGAQGIIFDGIPRRLTQAIYLIELLRFKGKKRFLIILLDVPRDNSLGRLKLRADIEHRTDDTEEAIHKRLDQYETDALPAIEYLKTIGDFYTIDGTKTVEEVESDINQILEI